MTDMPTPKQEKQELSPQAVAAIIGRYLDLVALPKKPRGRRTPEYLQKRVTQLNELLASGDYGGVARVEMIQERMECERDLAHATDTSELEEAEKGFIEHAAPWAQRKGISRRALREAGVPASVLKEAGI